MSTPIAWSPASDELLLYGCDLCPFAQRTWMCILEKEADPYNPTLHQMQIINFFNHALPANQDWLSISKTVPAGRYKNESLKESLDMNRWIDAKWSQNPLTPASDEGKKKMDEQIQKHNDMVTILYKIMQTQAPADLIQLRNKLYEVLRTFSAEVEKSGGPYLLGEQFTLADIQFAPFAERLFLCVPYFKHIKVPTGSEYAGFHRWYEAVSGRASFKVTAADRSDYSMATLPFGERKRVDYIREVYQSYAFDCNPEARAILRTAPPGKTSVDLLQCRVDAEKRKAAAQVPKEAALAVALGIAAFVVAKVWRK